MSTAGGWGRIRAELTRRWDEYRRDPWLPAVLVALLQSLVVLGPALGSGLVVVYDMAWAPDPRWTPFVLGLDTPAPRAVPSDAVAVALGHLVGAGAAQKLILVVILTALGLGAAVLMRDLMPAAGSWGRVAASIAAVWNPYVYERLAVGQWTVLLGLAVLPWAMSAALRVGVEGRRGSALFTTLVFAGAGGANSLVVVAASVLPILVCRILLERDVRLGRPVAGAVLVLVGMSAAWALPAMIGGAGTSAREGASAFVPTADTPLGVLGSLASGGGFWNVSSHPPSRQVTVLAVAAAVLGLVAVSVAVYRAARSGRWPLIAALALPMALVSLSVGEWGQDVWTWLVTGPPGGGLLRDSHKLMAVWVVTAAVGVGLIVELVRAGGPHVVRLPATLLFVGLPVALIPVLAWGLTGRLSAVPVPPEYRHSMDRLNDFPSGDVGLMPWNQYRRYDWNAGRVSLTLAPRLLTRTVVFNDALPLRAGTIAGESRRAAEVSRRLNAGEGPAEAFSAVGARYLALERSRASSDDEADLRRSGTVVLDEAALLVVELDTGSQPSRPATWPVLVGWVATVGTGVLVITAAILRRRE